MADTGAPWNIPYVENADLVKDYPTASLALANAIADGLDAANVGIGSNVVSTTKTDTFSVSLGVDAMSGDVTGLTVTITPTSASSKVLLLVSVAASSTSGNTGIAIYRDGSLSSFVGDADGSRTRYTVGTEGGSVLSTTVHSIHASFVDSPATTSAVTYSIRIFNSAGGTVTHYINRPSNDADSSNRGRGASSITAIEVAA